MYQKIYHSKLTSKSNISFFLIKVWELAFLDNNWLEVLVIFSIFNFHVAEQMITISWSHHSFLELLEFSMSSVRMPIFSTFSIGGIFFRGWDFSKFGSNLVNHPDNGQCTRLGSLVQSPIGITTTMKVTAVWPLI